MIFAMNEKIFNFFIYFESGVAREIGVRFHKRSGTDIEKTDFLRENVAADYERARRFDLPQAYTVNQWRAQLRIDGALSILDPILTKLNAPKRSYIHCLTPIKDGTPFWDQTIGPGAFRGAEVTDFGREGQMSDYLVDYSEGSCFYLDRLIFDDFFSAINILLDNKHYVSASKLLMSCIDTLAFVEFGDVRNNFTDWLDLYCDLKGVGVTAGELWEYRNAVLHMTSLDSRRVLRGDAARIAPYVAIRGSQPPQNEGDAKPFNLLELIDATSAGIQRWGMSYNASPEKVVDFINRYDMTISDKRIATIARLPDNRS